MTPLADVAPHVQPTHERRSSGGRSSTATSTETISLATPSAMRRTRACTLKVSVAGHYGAYSVAVRTESTLAALGKNGSS